MEVKYCGYNIVVAVRSSHYIDTAQDGWVNWSFHKEATHKDYHDSVFFIDCIKPKNIQTEEYYLERIMKIIDLIEDIRKDESDYVMSEEYRKWLEENKDKIKVGKIK